MKRWLTHTCDGRYKIERVPCPYSGANIDMGRPPAGVIHTTEGPTWESAMSVFRKHYAPTFLVGPGRIGQLVPLGEMDAALENAYGGAETNKWARVQIEVIGHSNTKPYSFDARTTDTLASLLATLKIEANIPLKRPYSDTMPAGGTNVWARESFIRRTDGKWGKTAGWFGHVEIPENSHWDPGALRWQPLLLEAGTRLPKPKPQPKLGGYWLVTKMFYDGREKTERTSALRIWTLRQGNLVKKGVRNVQAHWVETG